MKVINSYMSKDMNQEVDNKNTTLESQTTDNVGLNVSGHILINGVNLIDIEYEWHKRIS